MDLYYNTVQRLGAWVARTWWDKEGLDLDGASLEVAAAADGGEGREGEDEDCKSATDRN